jgi:hypothetical protein
MRPIDRQLGAEPMDLLEMEAERPPALQGEASRASLRR